jgi:hypothetical protein
MLRFFPIILLLAACGDADNKSGPGGMTVGEAKALDDAAAMLEERESPVVEPTPKDEE